MATKKQTPETPDKPTPPYRHEMNASVTAPAVPAEVEGENDAWAQTLSQLERELRGKEDAIVALVDPRSMWIAQMEQVLGVFRRHVMAATKMFFVIVAGSEKLELRRNKANGPLFVTTELQTDGLIHTEVNCYIGATAWSLRWLSISPQELARSFARLVSGDPSTLESFTRCPRADGEGPVAPVVEPSVTVSKEPEPNLKWEHFESTVVDVLQPAFSICLGPFSPTYVVSRNPRADSSFRSVLRMLANGELTGWETFKSEEEAMMTAETNLRVWGIAPPVVRFDRSVLNEPEQKPVTP